MNFLFLPLAKFFLYLAPLSIAVVTSSTFFPFIVGKYTFFKTVVGLSLLFAVLSWGFESRAFRDVPIKAILKNPIFLAVSLFIAIFSFAGIFGINPHVSFWSSFERGEGVFLLLYCYAFFVLLSLLFRKDSEWRKLFVISIIAGLLVIGYGVLAAFNVPGFLGKDLCTRFSGSLGNPAYLGTLSIFMLFYAGYMLVAGNVSDRNWQKRIFPALLLAIGVFFIFLLLSQTRGALLGLGVGVVSALLYLAAVFPRGKERLAILLLTLVLLACGILGIYFRRSINLLPFCEMGGGNRILDISLSTETYQTRWILWGQSLAAFKERPILGWGVENFSAAFEKYFDIRHKVWFDRAHNIFFDYLVFSGALGLLSFLGIFTMFFWQFLKWAKLGDFSLPREGKRTFFSLLHLFAPYLERALLFALPVAYLVQGLVLFDVLPIYINLFLFLSFAAFKFDSWKSAKTYV